MVPTKKAHILLSHAAREGKQHELQEVREGGTCFVELDPLLRLHREDDFSAKPLRTVAHEWKVGLAR